MKLAACCLINIDIDLTLFVLELAKGMDLRDSSVTQLDILVQKSFEI